MQGLRKIFFSVNIDTIEADIAACFEQSKKYDPDVPTSDKDILVLIIYVYTLYISTYKICTKYSKLHLF